MPPVILPVILQYSVLAARNFMQRHAAFLIYRRAYYNSPVLLIPSQRARCARIYSGGGVARARVLYGKGANLFTISRRATNTLSLYHRMISILNIFYDFRSVFSGT